MKKMYFLLLLVTVAFGAFADTIVMHDTIYASPAVLDPNQIPVGGGWSDWVGWVFGVVVVFIVQVILKVVPTWRSYDLFRWISTFTALIAKIFNGVGDAAKTDNGKKAVFKNTKVTLEK